MLIIVVVSVVIVMFITGFYAQTPTAFTHGAQ